MKYILKAVLMVLFLVTSSCGFTTKEKEKVSRPNFVFIMSDDHAVSAISAYKDWLADVAPTPNIDALAASGMIMTKMYNTNSICGPSRAAIITGKYSHVNGFFKNEKGGDFDGSQQTFPKLFQKNGYQTAVIGKWHLGTKPTGFDYSKVMVKWGGQGTYFNTAYQINGEEEVIESKRHSTAQVVYDAIDWIKNKKSNDKPFFLMCQFKAPHRPWEPDPAFSDMYTEDLPLPPHFNDDYKGRNAASQQWMEIENHMNRRDLKVHPPKGMTEKEKNKYYRFGNQGEFWSPNDTLKGKALKEWKYQTYIKDYLRCVAGVDKAVGEMTAYLKAAGLSENTVVVYTSDQGFYLGEHGWFDKRWMYEPSFRMPFIISYPQMIQPNSVSEDLLLNIDFAPTFLDLAGITVPDDIQGDSFKKVLQKQGSSERKALYYHYYEYPFWHKVQPHYGIRTKRYKLIHFYYDMDEWELYDLEKDPHEMNNIVNEKKHISLIEDLKGELKSLQIKYKDTMSLEEMRKMTDIHIDRVYESK